MEFRFGYSWDYKGKRGTYEVVWHHLFTQAISNWRRAWKRIIDEVLRPFVSAQFATQGREEGTSWARLAPSTLARRAPGPILVQTGRLKRSFTGGAEHVEKIDDARLAWGSAVPYALFHQTGTGVGYGKREEKRTLGPGRGMPQRPMLFARRLDLRDPWMAEMQRILMQEGDRAARAAGFAVLSPSERLRAGARPPTIDEISEAVL